MPENSNDRGRAAANANAVKRGAEASAKGIHHVTDFVARYDSRVTDGEQVLTQVVGNEEVDELTRSVPLRLLIQPGMFQQHNRNTVQHDCLQNGPFDKRDTKRLQ